MSQDTRSLKSVTLNDIVIAKINDNGRIVIPVKFRTAMGLKAGDLLIMTLEDGVLRMESQLAKIRKIQAEFQQFANSASRAAGDLVDERLEQAQREMKEWLG